MESLKQTTVTRLFAELRGGNRAVLDELFSLIYDALHALAREQRAGWHGDYTLNTTALVHEAYLKLVDQTQAEWKSRAHFLAVAAKAMRHILVDYARRSQAQKRGGDLQKVALEDVLAVTEERAEALVALEDALDRLAEVNEREAQVVECRFFGGMTIAETAAVLAVSPMTVKRDWAMAQAWLFRAMQKEMEP